MPFAALAVAFLILSGPIAGSDMSADPTKPVLGRSQPASVILALDDEIYGDRDDDADEEGTQPDDHDPSYGDDNDDGSDGDSANGPDDDDDGWDVDPLDRSERA